MSDQSPERLQQLGDEFVLMIGNCITQWASVEDELFEVCLACLGCIRERAAIVYYRTPTIDTRLTLADELVRTVLPRRKPRSGAHDPPDLKAWTTIQKDFRDRLRIRGRLAHQPVGQRMRLSAFGVVIGIPFSESWFEVYVSQNEQLRERSAELQPLKIEDLRTHLADVIRVRDALHRFRHERLAKHVAAFVPPDPPPNPQ
jgi:hypothetical protein